MMKTIEIYLKNGNKIQIDDDADENEIFDMSILYNNYIVVIESDYNKVKKQTILKPSDISAINIISFPNEEQTNNEIDVIVDSKKKG